MRIIVLVLISCISLEAGARSATIVPPTKKDTLTPAQMLQQVLPALVKDFKKSTGGKSSLKKKIAYKIWKSKFLKVRHDGTQTDKGKWSMILGIAGILTFLIIPIGPLLALPCAIGAILLGYSARKINRADKKAKAGIILGWITLSIFVFAVLIAAATLSWN
jgi:hypothetical protein